MFRLPIMHSSLPNSFSRFGELTYELPSIHRHGIPDDPLRCSAMARVRLPFSVIVSAAAPIFPALMACVQDVALASVKVMLMSRLSFVWPGSFIPTFKLFS